LAESEAVWSPPARSYAGGGLAASDRRPPHPDVTSDGVAAVQAVLRNMDKGPRDPDPSSNAKKKHRKT
jgi:hypothetical protein